MPGFKEHFYTIQDGRQRHAIIHLPPNYQNLSDMPIVFCMHGTGGNGEVAWQKWGWKELGNQEGFITVYPDALRYYIDEGSGPGFTTKWDHGRLDGLLVNPTPTGIVQTVSDDLVFMEELANYVMTTYDVDQTRCYATGFSNGASFVSRLAYQWSDRLAASGVVAGRIAQEVYADPVTYPQGQASTNLWHVYGDRDPKAMPFWGGMILPIDPSVFQNQYFIGTMNGGLTTAHIPLGSPYTTQLLQKNGERSITAMYNQAGVEYRCSVFSNMAHLYPNPQSYAIKICKPFWDFFKNKHK
jgi:poly(3-hydroxybutyrate) depolymerase